MWRVLVCSQRVARNLPGWQVFSRFRHASNKASSVEAFKFELTEEDARASFSEWCKLKTPFIFPKTPKLVQPIYAPFWAFEGTAKIESKGKATKKHYLASEQQDVEDRVASQVYGGYTFRRQMMDVLKSPLDQTVPFTGDLLNSAMSSRSLGAQCVDIMVDPFGVYEVTAWAVAREAIVRNERARATDAAATGGGGGRKRKKSRIRSWLPGGGGGGDDVSVTMSSIRSRRVYVPGWVVEYTHFGRPFRVFVHGVTGEAFGLAQSNAVNSFVNSAVNNALTNPKSLPTALTALLVMGPRVVLAIPYFLYSAGAALGLSALGALPAMARRELSYQQWEGVKSEERQQQRKMSDSWMWRNAWADAAAAEREEKRETRERAMRRQRQRQQQQEDQARAERKRRQRQRQQREARAAEADARAAAADAEARRRKRAEEERRYAEQQRQRQQRQQQQQAEQQRAQQRARRSPQREQSQRRKPVEQRAYTIGYNPSDYYRALGLQAKGVLATEAEVKAAFRRQLMRWHPDHQPDESRKAEASEHTRHILAAYAVLRNAKKRAAYDATYQHNFGRKWAGQRRR